MSWLNQLCAVLVRCVCPGRFEDLSFPTTGPKEPGNFSRHNNESKNTWTYKNPWWLDSFGILNIKWGCSKIKISQGNFWPYPLVGLGLFLILGLGTLAMFSTTIYKILWLLGPHKMKMCHYSSVSYTLLNLGLFLFTPLFWTFTYWNMGAPSLCRLGPEFPRFLVWKASLSQ